MATGTASGVYPCYDNQFKVKVGEAFKVIADMESYSVSFDDGVEEWNPYDAGGWVRRLKTAKGITISAAGKRNVGDAGNDYIAGLFMKNGRECEVDFQWTFPDGGVLEMTGAVINVTALGAADATNVAPLEFDIMSNGKPTYTPAA